MGNSVYSTPVVANDVLFIANKDHVFAIQATAARTMIATELDRGARARRRSVRELDHGALRRLMKADSRPM